MSNPISDLVNGKNVWFDIYDGANKVETTHDEAAAKRRVFAENSSFLNDKDKTWHVEKRIPKKLENA